jgi:hypothetical protein
VSLRNNYGSREVRSEEQILYDHFLQLAEQESPSRLIERFRLLFLDGLGYPDQEITKVVDALITTKFIEEEFDYILNRCFHILVNRWQLNDRKSLAIPELVYTFKDKPVYKGGSIHRSRNISRLHQLVGKFAQTEHYQTLCRLAQVIDQANESADALSSQPLGTLIRRYPYLYEHCLLGEDSDREHQQTIRKLQEERQGEFERSLSKYITYQVRRSQLAQRGITSPVEMSRIIQPVKNPTLLTGPELAAAIKHYRGKVQGSYTYQDMAQHFRSMSQTVQNFGDFKQELYSYLTSSIDPAYGKRRFNDNLYRQLNSVLPEDNHKKLNDLLVMRTCSQAISFLVVDSPKRLEHFTFIDLLGNLGPISTTGLLLKIVLFCRKVRPYLEKRLAILFNHYEHSTGESVAWLVKALENINVAFTTNSNSVDLLLAA